MSKQGIFDKLLAQTEICAGVGRKDILGESRLKNIVAARKIFWVALRMAGFTLTAIGNRVGREHSTVARETKFAPANLKDKAAACCLLCGERREAKAGRFGGNGQRAMGSAGFRTAGGGQGDAGNRQCSA